MSALVIIPARMASTRLPGKPLAKIAGIPMIICVARAAEAAGYGAPVIAAADAEIMAAAQAYGVSAVLTEPDLPSGSDRVCAAAKTIDPDGEKTIVVNVQGDMPELEPEHVQAVIEILWSNPDVDIATLAFQSDDAADRLDENVVKVLLEKPMTDAPVQAKSFTRAAENLDEGSFWHHIGIYAFRRDALERFCALPPSPTEKAEKLEQWRALENGMKIVCAPVQKDCPGIDSPKDLARIRALWKTRGQQ